MQSALHHYSCMCVILLVAYTCSLFLIQRNMHRNKKCSNTWHAPITDNTFIKVCNIWKQQQFSKLPLKKKATFQHLLLCMSLTLKPWWWHLLLACCVKCEILCGITDANTPEFQSNAKLFDNTLLPLFSNCYHSVIHSNSHPHTYHVHHVVTALCLSKPPWCTLTARSTTSPPVRGRATAKYGLYPSSSISSCQSMLNKKLTNPHKALGHIELNNICI